jgi:outer membrane protein
VALLALMAAQGPAAAQEIPQRLTLDDALRLARERNPSYRRAQVQADATGADVRAGWGAFLPSVSAGLSFSGATFTRVTGEDDFGQPRELPDPITFQSSSASQSVGGQLTLFDGFQNLNNLRAAREGSRAAEARLDAEALRVQADVSRRFYEALRARQRATIERQLLAAREEELEATRRLFQVAGRTQVDVLGAEIEVARQEQLLEQARGDARKEVLGLAEAVGVTAEEAPEVPELAGEFPAPFDPVALDQDSLVSRALTSHPRVVAAGAAAAQAGSVASAARGQRWPTLTAAASFSRGITLSSYEALFELNPRNRSVGFNLSLEVPLFTRFRTSQAIAQAAAQERTAQEDLRLERLALEREVRSALIDLGNAFRTVQLAERSAELGRRRAEMAREQYRLATIDFTALQQVVRGAADEERAALAARAEFARALVTAEELVGAPLRP